MGFVTKNNILIPLELKVQTQTEAQYHCYDNKIFDLEVTLVQTMLKTGP